MRLAQPLHICQPLHTSQPLHVPQPLHISQAELEEHVRRSSVFLAFVTSEYAPLATYVCVPLATYTPF